MTTPSDPAPAPPPPPHATIAILSLGQMGAGIATLLRAHNYRVITNISHRSAATQTRAATAGVEQLSSDAELVARADYVLSIVPPSEAMATARRVVEALRLAPRSDEGEPLWFLDLNAGSPARAREVAGVFEQEAQRVRVVDGAILGYPPRREGEGEGTWYRPGIPVSGPYDVTSSERGARLAEVLNMRVLGGDIGRASGLKACFAALTKGFTALALQSYTTAAQMGALPELKHYLDAYTPGVRARVEGSMLGCTGKAYRWVEEMRLIGETFEEGGGFGEGTRVFGEIAGVYEGVAGLNAEKKGEWGDVEEVVEGLGAYVKSERK